MQLAIYTVSQKSLLDMHNPTLTFFGRKSKSN